jgi:uncharacterized protein (TIGR02611 family)
MSDPLLPQRKEIVKFVSVGGKVTVCDQTRTARPYAGPMHGSGAGGGAERDAVVVDPDEDRWAWRARIKRNPTTRRVYRILVGVLGLAVMALGVVAIPAPGPGWAIVFVGLAILASEFEKADQLLTFARRHVQRWTGWIGDQALWLRMLIGLATLVLVLAVFWTYFALLGVPTWFPGAVESRLHGLPGLG